MWWLWAYECIFQQKKKKKDVRHMTFCDIALEVTSAYSVGQSCQKVTQIQVEKNRPHTLVVVKGDGKGRSKNSSHTLFTYFLKLLKIIF